VRLPEAHGGASIPRRRTRETALRWLDPDRIRLSQRRSSRSQSQTAHFFNNPVSSRALPRSTGEGAFPAARSDAAERVLTKAPP
jgi:hypothetical protein